MAGLDPAVADTNPAASAHGQAATAMEPGDARAQRRRWGLEAQGRGECDAGRGGLRDQQQLPEPGSLTMFLVEAEEMSLCCYRRWSRRPRRGPLRRPRQISDLGAADGCIDQTMIRY
ncbi:unnamed protein product [Urochloa humidicola]